MWNHLFYFSQALKTHLVPADLSEIVREYVLKEYGCSPDAIENRPDLYLDPGGMICIGEGRETFQIQEQIFINSEHILDVLEMWNLAKKISEDLYKVYLNNYQVLILPANSYLEIGAWLVANKAVGHMAKSELIAALSGAIAMRPLVEPILEEN